MPSDNLDSRPSVDTRVGIIGAIAAIAPGRRLSRRDGAKVVEIFGGRDNLPEVERPATSAATDFRLNHKPRKKTKEDNELRKLFADASLHAPTPPRARLGRCRLPATRPPPCDLPQAANTSRRTLQFDTNGDGSLDALEMTNVLKTMNKFESVAQVAAIIKGLDANGDGKVQLRELSGFLNSKPDKKTRPEEEEACAVHMACTHGHMACTRSIRSAYIPHVGVLTAHIRYTGGRLGHGHCFGGRQGHRGWRQRHAGA